MDIRFNKNMGNYRLIQLLGTGSFAHVYLGQHIFLETPAAIKVLKKGVVRDHEEQFLNEARTLKRLNHPNIVQVFDFGITEDEIPFLVMDYAPNGTLRYKYPRGTQIPLEIIISYVKQIASALQYAHNQKKIHRDVKPENMLLTEDGRVLLSDFGLVEIARTSMSLSQPKQDISIFMKDFAGTPLYAPPEQFRGRTRPASDQYALGIVVYEWLKGDPPFTGSIYGLMHQHRFASPPPLQGKNASVTPGLEAVVMKALAKEPQKRFASVQDFAQELENAYLRSASSIQTQLFMPTYRKESAGQLSQSQLQASKEPKDTTLKPSYTTLKIQSTNQQMVSASIISQRQQPLEDNIDTFLPSHDSSQDRGMLEQDAPRDWMNLRWFILLGAILTAILFPIGIFFQLSIATVLSLVPAALCIIPGLFQTAHYKQWYWFIGFVLLCPLAGILYGIVDPDPKRNPPNNLKQLIVLLASLGYAFFIVAIIMGNMPSASQWAGVILYFGCTFILSSWLLGFLSTLGRIGFGDWVMYFFFPFSAPFAGIISVYSKEMQPNE